MSPPAFRTEAYWSPSCSLASRCTWAQDLDALVDAEDAASVLLDLATCANAAGEVFAVRFHSDVPARALGTVETAA